MQCIATSFVFLSLIAFLAWSKLALQANEPLALLAGDEVSDGGVIFLQ